MHDIIVVGASAGGVEALQVLAAGLPADLKAAVFVVVHIGRGIGGDSVLPGIVSRAGRLPASHPVNGEQIRQGRIYIAPPNCHMLVDQGHIRLAHGPKENRTRPSINPLFRSAAHTYGARVTGVILTGTLDDGVAGLAEIQRHGGLTVVQDPATAPFRGMPDQAIHAVDVDFIVPLEEMAAVLANLAVSERIASVGEEPMERRHIHLTCPECRGPLWEERQGKVIEYRCRVGHVYSPLAFVQEHEDTVERTLWSAAVALEEAIEISEKLASELGPDAAAGIRKRREQLNAIKGMLEHQ